MAAALRRRPSPGMAEQASRKALAAEGGADMHGMDHGDRAGGGQEGGGGRPVVVPPQQRGAGSRHPLHHRQPVGADAAFGPDLGLDRQGRPDVEGRKPGDLDRRQHCCGRRHQDGRIGPGIARRGQRLGQGGFGRPDPEARRLAPGAHLRVGEGQIPGGEAVGLQRRRHGPPPAARAAPEQERPRAKRRLGRPGGCQRRVQRPRVQRRQVGQAHARSAAKRSASRLIAASTRAPSVPRTTMLTL